MELKNYTTEDLLQQLLDGNTSSMVVVSRASIEAIIKQLRKEQNLTQSNINAYGPPSRSTGS